MFGGAAVSGVVFLKHYTQRKIREWQETEINAMLERTKKRHHFEHLEKTCNQIILTLALGVRNAVVKELDTKAILNQLKQGSADKVALWNKLKVLSITRLAVIIYAYTMLVTFIKIQINLISGYIYINQTVDNVAGYDIQAKYLQLSTYFVSEGIQKLCSLIRSKVEQITAPISLNDQLTLGDMERIYWTITSSIFANGANDPVKNFSEYMILQLDDKDKETATYSKIIDETLDLLESDEVQNLTQRNIRNGFASFIDHISIYFSGPSKIENGVSLPGTSSQETPIRINSKEETINNEPNEFIDINKTTMAMAKIIPIVSLQVPDEPMPKDATADWLQRLILNNEIKTLGANIYEAFSCQAYI